MPGLRRSRSEGARRLLQHATAARPAASVLTSRRTGFCHHKCPCCASPVRLPAPKTQHPAASGLQRILALGSGLSLTAEVRSGAGWGPPPLAKALARASLVSRASRCWVTLAEHWTAPGCRGRAPGRRCSKVKRAVQQPLCPGRAFGACGGLASMTAAGKRPRPSAAAISSHALQRPWHFLGRAARSPRSPGCFLSIRPAVGIAPACSLRAGRQRRGVSACRRLPAGARWKCLGPPATCALPPRCTRQRRPIHAISSQPRRLPHRD